MFFVRKSRAINTSSLIFTLLLSLILISGCKKENNPVNNTDGNSTPGANEVFIQDDLFSPATKTVTAGTTVKWINKGTHMHTVNSGTQSAPTNMFASSHLIQNDTFTFTFSQPGTYVYYCIHHAGMAGTIIVQ